jgi:hypothetical protein
VSICISSSVAIVLDEQDDVHMLMCAVRFSESR